MAMGAVLSAPLLMTPCGSIVPTVTSTVSMRAGTSFLNSIQFRSFISRVASFCDCASATTGNSTQRQRQGSHGGNPIVC